MPWECTTCRVALTDDAARCPTCGESKSAWTVNVNRTRTLVITQRKKLECLRGRASPTLQGTPAHVGIAWRPTERAAVLTKAAARALVAEGRLPDPRDLLCLRLHPEKQRRWDLKLTTNCEGRPAAEVTLEFEADPARLEEARCFDVLVLCVHGADDGPAVELPAPILTLDVTDDTPLGHAPTLDVSALRQKPVRVQLGPDPTSPLVAARLETPFRAGRSFPRPTALPVLRQALERLAADPTLHALVVGHAAAGDPDEEAGRALALRRAEAVRALLVGDVASLRARFPEAPGPGDWSWEEVQWLLAAARGYDDPCYVGLVDDDPGPVTQRALGTFQLHRGLPVTYDLEDETLGRLLQEYLDLLGPDRPAPERVHVVGGGAWHAPRPYGPAAAGAEGLDGDRVDLFLGPGPLSPPPQACVDGPGPCPAYATWCDHALEELPAPERLPLPLRVVDLFGSPLAGHEVKLLDAEGRTLAITTTTRTGFAAAEAPTGAYALELSLAGRTERLGFFLDPDAVGGFVAVLPYDLRAATAPHPRPPGAWPPKKKPPPGERPPLRLTAFWALPAPFDDRPERPVDLVVPRGMEVALRWEVEGAEALRLEALTGGGELELLPVGPTDDGARHTPAASTTYKLVATGQGGAVALGRWVLVVVVAPLAGASAVHGGGSWMRVTAEAAGT